MPETPESYSRFLEYHGGHNPYGEPAFILTWGRDRLRQYAIPEAFAGPYRDCWILSQWVSPEEFGSPDGWDEQQLGPYPHHGAYLPFQIFRNGNEPVMLDTEHLNQNVLKLTLKVVLEHKHDSLDKRYRFLKDESDRVKAEQTQQLIDRIEDGAPAFIDAVSFGGQTNVNSVIKQKMEQLEKNLDRIMNVAQRFPRGGVITRSV